MVKQLTDKQTRFVDEYLLDLNATQAAIRAGYSPKTAKVIAHENLTKPYVAAAIQAKQAALQEKLGITIERVLNEIACSAFLDIADLCAEDGSVLPLSQIPEAARRAIAGIEVSDLFEGSGEDRKAVGTLKKIKLADKMAALDKLCKHLGMYAADNKQGDKAPAAIAATVTLSPEILEMIHVKH
jgi:phage terminase small subunit